MSSQTKREAAGGIRHGGHVHVISVTRGGRIEGAKLNVGIHVIEESFIKLH